MAVHAYCIAPSSHAPGDEVRGLGGAAVRAIGNDELCIWVSDLAARPDASMGAIRAHNDVVVAAMTPTVTPVPIRFGQWLADDQAAIHVLSSSRTHWKDMLETFAGAVEYGIRVFDPVAPAAPAAAAASDPPASSARAAGSEKSGTAYMEALARRVTGEKASGDLFLAELERSVGGLIVSQKTEPLRTAHGLLSVAHLVHLDRSDAYRDAVDGVRSRMPGLRLLSSGPWPPYSFVI